MEEKSIKIDGRKLPVDALNLIGISGHERVQNYELPMADFSSPV
jgi:hypothetical protein